MKRIYPAMALAGVATTMLGPLLPSFAARGAWSDAQSGALFTAEFLATVVLAATVGPLSIRLGYAALVRAGLLLIALGCGGSAIASPALLPVSIAICGAGLGLLIPSANLAAARSNPGQSAKAVVWMNMSWSIGSVVSPLAIAALGGAFLWTLAAATIVMAAIVGAGPRDQVTIMRATSSSGVQIVTVITAALLFLYSGTESALGGWLSTYTRRLPAAGELWAIMPTIFWSGVLMGRVAAPSVIPRIPAGRLVKLCMFSAIAGTAIIVAGQGPSPVIFATALAGLSMAPIFPLVVAQYADRTGGGSASGLLFVASGLGGAVIPPLVGIMAGATGSLRTGLGALLIGMAGMIGLEWRLSR
jgi:fucose permease